MIAKLNNIDPRLKRLEGLGACVAWGIIDANGHEPQLRSGSHSLTRVERRGGQPGQYQIYFAEPLPSADGYSVVATGNGYEIVVMDFKKDCFALDAHRGGTRHDDLISVIVVAKNGRGALEGP